MIVFLILAGIFLVVGVGFQDFQFPFGWNFTRAGVTWMPLHPPTARVAGVLCFLFAYLDYRPHTELDVILMAACALVLFILLGISLVLGSS